MTQVVMNSFQPGAKVQTIYSGLVTATAGGHVTVDIRDAAVMMGAGFFFGAPVNITATTDPTSADDVTRGWVRGSTWINQSYPRLWYCTVAAAGNAVWQLLFQTPGRS